MSYEINVLVNGSRCKQYPHQGKLFIEAKKGSEYSIEIKNNIWSRILAVCSVDGLDVLSGKKADENGNGYVINGYGSLKIDGFRVSNEKVAKFLFDYKGGSYAASKEDGSEKNVGVIGVRIFTEKIKPLPPPPVVVREEHHHHHHNYPLNPWGTSPYYGDTTIWYGSSGPNTTCGNPRSANNSGGGTTYGASLNNMAGAIPCAAGPSACGPTPDCDEPLGFFDSPWEPEYSKGPISEKCSAPRTKGRSSGIRGCSADIDGQMYARSLCSNNEPEPKGFDMGTKFGEAKESRVIEVEFEKGIIALTTNIYYASRQSLIEMGVPLGNEKQVSFPEPFENGKYATPPSGWRG